MALEQALQALRSDPELGPGFVEWRELPAVEARYAAFPMASAARLIDALGRRGIERLYTHQAQATAARAPGREHRRRDADGLREDALLQPARRPGDPRRPRGAGALPLPDEGAGAGPDGRAARADRRPRRGHPHVHLRRRHAGRRAAQGARGRAHRRHEPGHAAHRHPAPPHEVGEALREPALRRDRRAAPVPRRLRQPRRERHPAAAAHLPLLRLRPRRSSAARRRSPTRASWRENIAAQADGAHRRQRRAARAEGQSPSTTRRW